MIRTVSHRVARIPTGCADSPSGSTAQRPALVFGPEVDRSRGLGRRRGVRRKGRRARYGSALPDRASFPEDHRLYQGQLPMTVAGVTEMLGGHDLVVVIGAQVFRYYPYVAGEYLPEGTELLQITADPRLAATAPVGDSLLGDTLLVLEQLVDMVDDHSDRAVPAGRCPPPWLT